MNGALMPVKCMERHALGSGATTGMLGLEHVFKVAILLLQLLHLCPKKSRSHARAYDPHRERWLVIQTLPIFPLKTLYLWI